MLVKSQEVVGKTGLEGGMEGVIGKKWGIKVN